MAGLEILFCAVKSQLRAPSDALVCSFHWNIISNGFKCLGNGEQDPGKGAGSSEMLPEGWNASQDLYSMCYRHQATGEVYILKVIRMDDSLLVHMLRLKDEQVSTMTIRTADYVGTDLSSFSSAYLKQDELNKRFCDEILKELNIGGSSQRQPPAGRENPSQDRGRGRDEADPLRVPSRHPPRRPHPGSEWNDPGDPFSLGRADLDPLAGGGGMMFDPFRSPGRPPVPGGNPNFGIPGRLPPGSVPPGARFDPFGPPDPDFDGRPRRGGRGGPDPDHLPPPGYDDMFM